MSKKTVVKSGSEMEFSGSYFSCRLIRSEIPKESALGPVLFNIFVNNLDKATLIEFSGHMKLKGSVDNLNGRLSRGTWTRGKNKKVGTMVWSHS